MKKGLSFLSISILILFFVIGAGPRNASAAEPIKIGFMAPYVGVFATFGSRFERRFQDVPRRIREQGGGEGHRLSQRGDEGKPEVGLVKARKLVEKDQVQILAGIISSAVAYASGITSTRRRCLS